MCRVWGIWDFLAPGAVWVRGVFAEPSVAFYFGFSRALPLEIHRKMPVNARAHC